MSNSRITTKSKSTASALAPLANRHVHLRGKEQAFVYKDSSVSTSSGSSPSDKRQGFVYKDSSLSILSRSSPNVENTRSGSGLIGPQRNSGPGGSGAPSREHFHQDDDEADDQQSTEPIPTDIDFLTMFPPSPPSRTCQDGPITRAGARAKAQALNQTENDNHEGSVDGPSERHTIIDREGSVSSVVEDENTKSSLDDEYHLPKPGNDNDSYDDGGDDEYQLPESENSYNSSEIITDIVGRPKKLSKKPTKAAYPSKPKGKQVAKAEATPVISKKDGRPTTKKTASSTHRCPILPNQDTISLAGKKAQREELSPIRQTAKFPTGNGGQEAPDVISDSQGASQELTVPPKAKSRSSNSRRAKPPFYPANLGRQQVKLQLAPYVHNTSNIRQQPTARRGEADSSSPDETEGQEDRTSQDTNPKRHNTLAIPRLGSLRESSNNNGEFPTEKEKGCTISHNKQNVIFNNIDEFPILWSPDQQLQLTDGEYGGTYIQGSPYRTNVEIGKRSINFESIERPVRKIKVEPAKGFFNNVGDSSQASLPRLSPDPACCSRINGTKNGATQTENLDTASSPSNFCHQWRQGREEEIVSNNTIRHRLLGSSPAHNTSGLSQRGLDTTTTMKARYGAEKIEHLPSSKVSRVLSDTEESLHPNSVAWAQRVAEKSRQNNSTSTYPIPSEALSLGLIPAITREHGKNPVSKREITLARRRDAVFESVQEVTSAMLRHLQSKESPATEIVDIYWRNGRMMIDRLLGRQSNELREVISAFDRKCIRLRGMFDEAAHNVRAIHERAAKRGAGYDRTWRQRRMELDEEIKMVREATTSI
ncbi:hypothetical protein ANO14919_123990 [Xylariales sp. No.14919]|nr:hypothetical protein ANO14919_123990 [Xylariales sp. No.14919]